MKLRTNKPHPSLAALLPASARRVALVIMQLSVAAGSLALLIQPVPARAADIPVTLGVSPAIAEISAGKGQNLSRELIVENKADTPLPVQAHAENFEASDPYGAISFNTDNTRQYAASSWIKLKNPSLILAPHQRITLSFTIDCPPDAEPGGHYATILLQPVAAVSSGPGSKLGITQRVGALLFITVGGNNLERGNVLGASTSGACTGRLCSFKTAPFREWGPVPFSFQFANTGNVHVKAGGKITIKDMFGRPAGEASVDQKTVLPGSARAFEVTWPREVLFGRYDASLSLTYGAQHQTETAHTTFWVIPWRALGLIGLILVAVLAVCLVRRKTAGSRRKPAGSSNTTTQGKE